MNDEQSRLREIHTFTEEIFHGEILHVQKDTVSLPNGKPASRELIRHIGAVCVIPLTEDRQVVVERQYRYPIDRVVTEIPAGKLDFSGEDRLEAAKRELREETGLTADRWDCLGDFYPAPAYSDERLTLYLARNLHEGQQELDEDEFLDLQKVSLQELVRQALENRIPDSKTQLAILKTDAWLRYTENLK